MLRRTLRMDRVRLAEEVVRRLSERYKQSLVERVGKGVPYRVFVATILSQRTRDEVTERVAERFLRRWGDVKALAAADVSEVQNAIKEVGLAPAKARYLVSAARIILQRFNSQIPKTEEELLSLPGVGQKTAGCVLVYAYGQAAIPVDTHVHRIANLLGLVKTKTPEQTRRQLQALLPRHLWLPVNRIFVLFGREICRQRKPACQSCPLADICPSAGGKETAPKQPERSAKKASTGG